MCWRTRRPALPLALHTHLCMSRPYLVFLEAFGHRSVNTFGAQARAQLADDHVASILQQPSICAKQLEQIHHKESKEGVVAPLTYLRQELKIASDHSVRGVGQGLEESRKGAIVGCENLWRCVSMQ